MPIPAAASALKRILYRCTGCGRKLKEFLPSERKLGAPELICTKCGARTPCSHQAEWVDLTAKERRGIVISTVLATFFAGGALGVLAGAVAFAALYMLGAGDTAALAGLFVMIAAGMLVFALRGILAVSASKNRTKGRNL